MTTIKEVAARAKVSTATVSRVLANPGLVQPATQSRVLEAVKALGYSPNFAARSLRTHSTAKIIVTVPDISNPFFSSVMRGVEESAQVAGYSVLLGDTRGDRVREELYATMLLRKEADGLIFLGHRLAETLTPLLQKLGPRAPIVNGCEFSPELNVPSVHIDNARAAYEAMAFLHALGHRRIGLLAGPPSPITRDRLQGARRFAAEHDISANLQIERGDFSIETGARATTKLLSTAKPPTGIFCFSDELAMGAMWALDQQGLSCPADVSVIGFDDIRYARFLQPALTTIRQPMAQLGQMTVSLLLQILSGTPDRPASVTLPHDLVVRASTGPAPARTRRVRQ
jgi:LacI family transcriptional regulator, repressor for deo operon, udp, cdd, tsx, nupC, and nupG